MALSDAAVKNAKTREKAYKLADGAGMYLFVTAKGQKYWRLDYRLGGRRKTLALGVYPDVSLKKARERRQEARILIADGIDPSEKKQAEKRALAGAESFEAIAREWFAKYSPNWAHSHSSKVKLRLENDAYPYIGKSPVSELTPPEILKVLRRVESRGALETAHRIRQYIGQVMRYAVATGRAERDPTQDLRGALPPTKTKHHGSIVDPKRVGELLRALDGYEGHHVTRCALKLAPLVFVRPGELRNAEWSDFSMNDAEWRIPAVKMKMRQPHIVPLSNQAIEIIQDLHPLTGNGTYLFPSVRSWKRPISENTINAALRRLGYEPGEMTGHGFRSMASTLLNEQGWHHDAIERQLAHAERNNVRAAYNYAEYLPERRQMMQAWADYLDSLKSGGQLITMINRGLGR
jgi:integrase